MSPRDNSPDTKAAEAAMSAETLTALQGSIAKWERVATGEEEDKGCTNCPLCHKFFPDDEEGIEACAGCPVREATGKRFCVNTPYVDFHKRCVMGWAKTEEQQRLARAELDFLKSLLPRDISDNPEMAEAKT